MKRAFEAGFCLRAMIVPLLFLTQIGVSGLQSSLRGRHRINAADIYRRAAPKSSANRLQSTASLDLDRADLPKRPVSIYIAASLERMNHITDKLIPALAASPGNVSITLVSSVPETCDLAGDRGVLCLVAPRYIAKGDPPFPEDTMERFLWYSQVTADLAFTLAQMEHDADGLFLEDDVIHTSQWYLKLMALIDSIPNSWSMLDLYVPDLPRFANGAIYNFYCCTQAILFNRGATTLLSQYLYRRIEEEPPDWLLRDFQKENLKEFEVRVAMPSLFQHVSLGSTLAEKKTRKITHRSYSFRP